MSPPDSLCSSPGSGMRWQLHLHQARSAAAAQRGCRLQPCAECPRGWEPVLTAAGATERTWSGVGLKWRRRRGPRDDPVSWLELALERSLTTTAEPGHPTLSTANAANAQRHNAQSHTCHRASHISRPSTVPDASCMHDSFRLALLGFCGRPCIAGGPPPSLESRPPTAAHPVAHFLLFKASSLTAIKNQ